MHRNRTKLGFAHSVQNDLFTVVRFSQLARVGLIFGLRGFHARLIMGMAVGPVQTVRLCRMSFVLGQRKWGFRRDYGSKSNSCSNGPNSSAVL